MTASAVHSYMYPDIWAFGPTLSSDIDGPDAKIERKKKKMAITGRRRL
jgi:hypothetical protein